MCAKQGGMIMKNIIFGTLAHVDAGKTTLSESLLYQSGSIRKMGRVDHGNAFLDFDTQEKARGITIFSKQSRFQWKDTQGTLIDTPGHVDLSTEMERTLQILDYAILVINAVDGVQTHTETIWNLLKHYQVPTFLFINKMDISLVQKETLIHMLKTSLSESVIDFTEYNDEFYEQIALSDEDLLEEYVTNQSICNDHIKSAICKRKVFPCFFGSALKMQGIESFLDRLDEFTSEKTYKEAFGATVYKITRDEQGNRLTHMKITGGTLKAKQLVRDDEKVDQIRIYSGNKFEMVNELSAGQICAVKGLKEITAGEGLGFEEQHAAPVLTTYMNYALQLPDHCDPHTMMIYLQQLVEEDPQLRIQYQKQKQIIYMQLMGEIQIEILKNIIAERFHVNVEFGKGDVIYKETITSTVEGVGHYEPLRHYAEVHLLLRPGEKGSGLHFHSDCFEDELDRRWQRLILSHLEEKEHVGVLGGFPITDIEIVLLTGKAHQKHTEGGDFRQATYRAVRQGLKEASCILLEPYFSYKLEVPTEQVSKAIFDIDMMHGDFVLSSSATSNDVTILTGTAPVSKMQNYQADVIAYTKGRGKLTCVFKGYRPCDNEEDIVKEIQYDSEADIDNPTGSIFCSHGAGFYVPWDQVKSHMHIHSNWGKQELRKTQYERHAVQKISDDELKRIYERTYGVSKEKPKTLPKKPILQKESVQPMKRLPECLLVDGYNVIHDWPELREDATTNLDAARMKLINMMSNYQGYKKCTLILVFDAYQVAGGTGEITQQDNIFVVYTKTAQTADMYIERATHKLAKEYHVVVATSDGLEQLIAIGQGAMRMSSRQLHQEYLSIAKKGYKEYEQQQKQYRTYPLEAIKDYNE